MLVFILLSASTGIPINTTATQYSYMQTRKMTQTEGYIFTAVPPPLPLNCPFQHLHTWQSLTDSEESGAKTSFSEFKQARLKIIMMEGVVYRYVLEESFSIRTLAFNSSQWQDLFFTKVLYPCPIYIYECSFWPLPTQLYHAEGSYLSSKAFYDIQESLKNGI